MEQSVYLPMKYLFMMGITKEEGAAKIFFEHEGEKQYWVGKESTVSNEFPGSTIFWVKPL